MNNEQQSFLDTKTIIAIILMTLMWFGWQLHLGKKYGTQNTNQQQVAATASTLQNNLEPQTAANLINEKKPTEISAAKAVDSAPAMTESKTIKFEDENWSFEIANKGMSVRNVHLKKFTTRTGERVTLADDVADGAFETVFLGNPAGLTNHTTNAIYFDLKQEGLRFIGTAVVGGMSITKIIDVDSANYLLNTRIEVQGQQSGVMGLVTTMNDRVEEAVSGGFMMPAVEQHAMYAAYANTNVRVALNSKGTGSISEKLNNVSVAHIGSLYFGKAIVDQSEIRPDFISEYQSAPGFVMANGRMEYTFPSGLNQVALNYKAFAGPKELELLKSIDPKMEGMIDYWVLGSLAKPMLKLLKWLNSLFHNWGVAIIFLTIIVRLLVLPLYAASFKSTKAMQAIQPQMKAIQEKYKNDRDKLNQEVMRLFKDNKVNPLGGCLPMLLQLPIFIALYRVLSQSIELYQAPFMLWIHDLSVKDPFYVLPVLMGVAMFLQQKMTPMTTMDPAQQKVMMFMPILFSFMMISLPSGLTLYILISTIFTILQQIVFTRGSTTTLNAKPVKA